VSTKSKLDPEMKKKAAHEIDDMYSDDAKIGIGPETNPVDGKGTRETIGDILHG
jgi:hypothetical protein